MRRLRQLLTSLALAGVLAGMVAAPTFALKPSTLSVTQNGNCSVLGTADFLLPASVSKLELVLSIDGVPFAGVIQLFSEFSDPGKKTGPLAAGFGPLTSTVVVDGVFKAYDNKNRLISTASDSHLVTCEL